MSNTHTQTRPIRYLVSKWRDLLRTVMHWWIRTQTVPEALSDIELDPAKPVCYVLESYALTNLLILEQICRQQGWPPPTGDFAAEGLEWPRSYGAMRRYGGILLRRLRKRRHPDILKSIVDAASEGRLTECQIVPVTVLIGRAPEKVNSITKILFSENWDVGGRLRRFLSSLINGRNTFVQFGQPVTLERLMADSREDGGPEHDLRRLTRVLRVHFKRVRTAAIGPDRSHRRTLIERVVAAPAVREAIDAKARRDGITREKAEQQARKYAFEVAANYSYSFIRILEILFTWFFNRIYRGIKVNHFSAFREAAPGHEIVYVPCHRSHIDYMLLSYVVYQRGHVPPHIAAGLNLNLPLVGRLLRKGGAFYLRRSFRTQQLYAAVFNEYVRAIISRGVALEYFIEGTRSRTGRLLPPKGGMLNMTVRAFIGNPVRPILFQPVYLGYERLAEGSAYISELSGADKKPESLSDFRNVTNILRKNYGEVHVSFGEPILLDDLLQQHHPGWREDPGAAENKPAWLPPLIDDLAARIMVNINRAAHVNPINLLACALLASRKHALDEEDLRAMLGLYQALLKAAPYSDRVTVTGLTPGEVIEYGLNIGVIARQTHKLGSIIHADQNNAVLLTYFRNNVSHLLALPSWIACCFINTQRVRKTRIRRLSETVYPFLRRELFLPWNDDELTDRIQAYIQALTDLELLRDTGESLQRATGGTDKAYYLRLLGNVLLQTFERYYITISVLVKNGSGELSRAQLEKLCMLTAQRMSILHEFEAPEFSDRTLFKLFIESLQNTGILSRTGDGRLTFDKRLELFAKDAKLVLGKEIRHGIIQMTPDVLEMEGEKEAA